MALKSEPTKLPLIYVLSMNLDYEIINITGL